MRTARHLVSRPCVALALGLGIAACIGGTVACRAEHPEAQGAGPTATATARGKAASGHVTLGGDYRVDKDALTTCALFPNHSFQVALNAPQAPLIFLYIKNYAGAGTYDAEARVRANYSGETMRVSRAAARTEIRVVPAADHNDLISGTFAGQYKGEGGQGTIAGRFESCLYPHLPH
jgi:hypothetical protein